MLFVLCIAQAQNPWKKYGYTPPKALTLSNGQYEEFFTNDTVVQIGSVMFNTVTNEVVAFLETETVYSEATLRPEVISRFLSPDPLEKQYPEFSPYQYAGNSPIKFIDLDGLEPADPQKLKTSAKAGIELATAFKTKQFAGDQQRAACNIGLQGSVKGFTDKDYFSGQKAKAIYEGLKSGKYSDFEKITDIKVPSGSKGKISEYLKPLQDLANEGYFVVGATTTPKGDFHVVNFVPGEMEQAIDDQATKVRETQCAACGKVPQVMDTGNQGNFPSTPMTRVSGRETIANMEFFIYNPKKETEYKKLLPQKDNDEKK